VNLGDIWWMTPPPAFGHVQQGRRPGIVWQDRAAFPNVPTVLMIPLTSQQAALRYGAGLLVHPSKRNGLAVPSVALVFQLAAIDPRRLGAKIGELDDPDRLRLQALTKVVLGLP
jgi:mRNA interferase MazF